MIEITLPWPPTVNNYWQRNADGSIRISKEGKSFREAVCWAIMEKSLGAGLASLVKVSIEAYAPDNRRRDIYNVLKALLDALTHAGVWRDDDQVDDLRIRWMRDAAGKKIIGGMVKVTIEGMT